jgi:two-component system OmpR family response regulator
MKLGEIRRIALLDDSPTVRELLATVLAEAGCETHPCAEWNELEAVLKAHTPDLVLLDVEMPDIVGEHIGFGLKRSNPGLRVVYLSDQSPHTLAALCEQTGVDGYIRKSSDVEQLVRDILAQLPE